MLSEVRQEKTQRAIASDGGRFAPINPSDGLGSKGAEIPLAQSVSVGLTGSVKLRRSRKTGRSEPARQTADVLQSPVQTDSLGIGNVISPSDALGADSVRKAGNREMLVFAQNESALLRRQEALFRQASEWITRVPENRREGVRQAVMVYARNVRSWQMQTQEQEAAFLVAQDKDQQARARFMLAEKGLTEAAQRKLTGFMGLAFPFLGASRKRRLHAQTCMEQACEHSAAVREALNDQGLAIHRYMRFQSEWRQSIEEMMAFVAEQSSSC